MQTVTLYRPVGLKELELIINADYKAFPPRLVWQPIFYPVLNEAYAVQIASEWNTKDPSSGYCGIVTAFDLDKTCYNKYEIKNVGGEIHNELWVPAEELNEFNQHIIGVIKITKVFFGDAFMPPENKVLAQTLQQFQHDTVQ